MRILRLGLLQQSAAVLLWACITAMHAQAPTVTLTPAIVEAGSPVLIRVALPAGTTTDTTGDMRIEGEWLGQKLAFFWSPDRHAWYALAGVDVEGPSGPSNLRIRAVSKNSGATDLSRSIEIHEAHYRTGTLTVSPKFVEPPAEESARIKAEIELKAEGLCSERARAALVRRFSRAGSRAAH